MEEEKTTATPAPAAAPGGKDVEDNKSMAAIAYLWILFLIPLLAKKDSPFAQYHAKQGMILFIGWVIAGFIFWLPFVGWILDILLLILLIIGLVNALGGKMKPLPVIGGIAEKWNF